MNGAEKAQLRRIIEMIREMQAIIQDLVDQPEPPSRGRIEFRDAVIELPDSPADD